MPSHAPLRDAPAGAPALSRNRLLGALPPATRDALRPHLTRVTLADGDVLYAPWRPITHVYFPATAVASVLSVLGGDARRDARAEAPTAPTGATGDAGHRAATGGPAVEVGTVGCEGLVGLSVFLSGGSDDAASGAGAAPAGDASVRARSDHPGIRAVAQIPGEAWRMPADAFAALADAPGPLHRLLLRYTEAYLAQVSQTAACNAAHHAEARCARWLLATRDRVAGDWLPLSRAFLAAMLGIRETGVAAALAGLAAQGLVDATPDAVTILDRRGLERAVCACYDAVRAEYGRLLGPPAVGALVRAAARP